VTKTRVLAFAIALLALVCSTRLAAHEIPRDVTVHAFMKPEGTVLKVVLRVPLAATRDILFPERDGLLDVERAQPDLLEAIGRWILPTMTILEDGRSVGIPTVGATRVSLPSDRSFSTYDTALAHVSAGDVVDPQIPANQAMLDVLVEYPIQSDRARFAIRPGFERLGVNVLTVLRLVSADGAVRAFEVHGDPGLVQLDPRWHQAALRFVKLGFVHILGGADHLLFLVCLILPFRRLRPLMVVVTAFTAAHSLTLIASALGLGPNGLWFPPLVETLIAASIVFLALENIVRGGATRTRWIAAFALGLVHGFGFSFALKETLQFAGSHLLVSLLSFNIGVEIGQVLVLVAMIPALNLLFRHVVAERMGVIATSAIVAHTAWHWMTDRWMAFRAFPLPLPDPANILVMVRVLLVATALAALVWLTGRRRLRANAATRDTAETASRG
jgi:hypothetical protein